MGEAEVIVSCGFLLSGMSGVVEFVFGGEMFEMI